MRATFNSGRHALDWLVMQRLVMRRWDEGGVTHIRFHRPKGKVDAEAMNALAADRYVVHMPSIHQDEYVIRNGQILTWHWDRSRLGSSVNIPIPCIASTSGTCMSFAG